MNHYQHSADLTLIPLNTHRLALLCGQFDEHLRHLERHLTLEIHNRGPYFHIKGPTLEQVNRGLDVLKSLYEETENGRYLKTEDIHLCIQQKSRLFENPKASAVKNIPLKSRHKLITPRSPNQEHYVHNILTHDLNFGIGPAGTGKTYLAVASAVAALEQERVRRILLVRPAVEAGERLGFLPGDLTQKIDPYLRPLYDALYDIMGFDRVTKLLEQQIIEVASLAYMRGRTLNESFIILDEAQNTTVEQMKMFLTRLGFNSTAVITGDVTQVDLPKGKLSGLKQVMGMLNHIPHISFTFFQSSDVVRHPIVQKIIEAYEEYELQKKNRNFEDVD